MGEMNRTDGDDSTSPQLLLDRLMLLMAIPVADDVGEVLDAGRPIVRGGTGWR